MCTFCDVSLSLSSESDVTGIWAKGLIYKASMVHCAAIFRSIIRPPLSFECLKITCLMRAVSGPYLGFRVTALTVHSPIVLALKGYWRFPRSTSHSADTETEAQKVAVFAKSPTAIKQCKASLSYLQGPFTASTVIKKGVTRAGGTRGG